MKIEPKEGSNKENSPDEVSQEVKPETNPEETNIKSLADVPEKSQRSRRPWQPSSILTIPAKFKDPKFVYRWCTKGKEGNIRRKLMEGWEMDTEVMKKMKAANYLQDRTMQDGESSGTNLTMREMVLMRMPKNVAAERQDYYQEKSVSAKRDAQRKYEEAMDGRGYGSVRFK